MAVVLTTSGKPAKPGKRRVKTNGSVAGPRKAGTFMYRGLKIKPTFVEDERSKQLEQAMRDFGLKTHVLAE